MSYLVSGMFLFGALFAFVFRDILLEIGLTKEQVSHPASVLILPIIAFAGTMIYPFFFMGRFEPAQFSFFYEFAGGVFFWMTMGFFAGGAARFGYETWKSSSKPAQPSRAPAPARQP